MGVLNGLSQLPVQVKLYEIVISNLIVMFGLGRYQPVNG